MAGGRVKRRRVNGTGYGLTAARSSRASAGTFASPAASRGHIGRRSSPVSRPSSFIAVLIGIGLVATPSMSRHSGNSLRCHCCASAILPGLERLHQRHHVARHDVADDRHHARPPIAHERQRQAVVAAEDGQVAQRRDLRRLVERAGRFLDGDDGRALLGQAGDRLRQRCSSRCGRGCCRGRCGRSTASATAAKWR